MAKEEIYDRIELCNNIISEIQNIDETQAYILYSGAGIGKSSVSKKIAKLVAERNINKDIIRIKSTQNDSSQEGLFLLNIFQNIRKYFILKNNKNKSRYRKYSYDYYIRHLNFAVIKKLIEQTDVNVENYKNIGATITHFIQIILDFISIKLGLIENLETAYTDNKIVMGYIKSIFEKENIVLCIENTQNFDYTSLDSFTELLIETKQCSNYFIFEYTLTENSKNLQLLNKIKNELDYSEIIYKISELEKLDIEYVLELAKQLYNSDDGSFMLKIEHMYTGNVKKIENFVFNYTVQTADDTDPTFVLLQGLSNNQKYIMAIILLNNTIISEQVLRQVLNNSNDIYISNFEQDLKYLTDDARLLEKTDNFIQIKDLDTVDSWNKNSEELKKYEALAYKNCEAIFSRILENGIEYSLSRKECIILLLQLYNRFDAIKLNNILKYIDEVIYEIISIDELNKYIERLLEILYPKKESLKILYDILDICNRHQLIDLASLCLIKISKIIQSNINEKYLFYYYTNLLQKGEYQILLNKIEENKNLSVNTSFQYYVELFKIIAYVSLHCTTKCEKIVMTLENDPEFKETLQFGFFLRLAEAYSKRNVAIPKVEKSITIFNKFAMDTQAAKSQVSLSFLYSIT